MMNNQRVGHTNASTVIGRGVFFVVISVLFGLGCGGKSPQDQGVETPPRVSLPSGPAKSDAPEIQEPGPDLSGVDSSDVFVVDDALPNFVVGNSPPKTSDLGEVVLVAPQSAPMGPLLVDVPKVSEAGSFRLPDGFTAIGSIVDGLPSRIRADADSSELVLVSRGTFVLGSDDGSNECRPAVSVELDAFYIGLNEVTVGQVRALKLALGNKISIGEFSNNSGDPKLPAVGLPWVEARAYAKAIGGDLPTEAQWEKAARGAGGFPFPWGRSRPLWLMPRTVEQIDAVGSHPDDRSPFGAFDMAGNAREWTLDFFQEGFGAVAGMTAERRRNWAGPRSTPAGLRVVKGNGPGWKVWARSGVKMSERNPQIGFRCVLNLQ